MEFVRFSRFNTTQEVISNILNCVCPECGGRMGGPGREFRCQGQCQADWRRFWEHAKIGIPLKNAAQ